MVGQWCTATETVTMSLNKLHEPEQMIVTELKAWLTSRGAPTKGRKRDLIDRQAE